MELVLLVGGLLFVGLWVVAITDAVRNRPCPYCVKKIHKQATRCPYCTSPIPPPVPGGPRP